MMIKYQSLNNDHFEIELSKPKKKKKNWTCYEGHKWWINFPTRCH